MIINKYTCIYTYEINNKVGYFEKQLSINKNNKNVFKNKIPVKLHH